MICKDRSNIIRKSFIRTYSPPLCITYEEDMESLISLVQNLKDFESKIIIMNNSLENDEIPSIHNNETWGQGLKYIEKTVIIPTQPLSFTQSMNYFGELCLVNEEDYYLATDSNMRFAYSDLEKIVTQAEIFSIADMRWGIVTNKDNSIMAISKNIISLYKWQTDLCMIEAIKDYIKTSKDSNLRNEVI